MSNTGNYPKYEPNTLTPELEIHLLKQWCLMRERIRVYKTGLPTTAFIMQGIELDKGTLYPKMYEVRYHKKDDTAYIKELNYILP
jgi:hypothetical protein